MSFHFSYAGPAPGYFTYELYIQSLTDGRIIYAININTDVTCRLIVTRLQAGRSDV